MILEALICWKFRDNAGNIIYTETPYYISLPWISGVFILVSFYMYLRLKKNHSTKYPAGYYLKK